MSQAVIQQPDLPAPVASRLWRLRQALAAFFAVDGCVHLLAWLVCIALVDLAIDYTFRLDRAQRTILLVLTVGALGVVAWRRIVRPLSATTSDDALCLAVERRHPQLGESLISAVQFSRATNTAELGLSPMLVDATIAQGVRASEAIDFVSTVNRAAFRRNQALLALLALLLGGGIAAIIATSTMSIWFSRNVLLASTAWPQSTYLTIVGAEEGKVSVPRGDDWTQAIHVSPESLVEPEVLYIDYRPALGRPTEPLKRVGERRYEVLFANVSEPFQFRVRGGDDTSDWVQVALVERPAVEQLTLTVHPPAYTQRSAEELPPGKGPYDVLAGSRLVLEGFANKALSAAHLAVGETRVPLTLDENKFRAELAPEQLASGTYAIHLTDRVSPQPLTSKRPASFGLRVLPDRAPRVRARVDGISGMIIPKARIPLVGEANDDFAVTGVKLVYQAKNENGQTALAEKTLPFEIPSEKLGQPTLPLREMLEAAQLGVQPGMNLSLVVRASDNRPGAEPQSGQAAEILLQVVNEEQFRADVLRREKEQRQEFEHLLKQQEDMLTDCRALAAAVAEKKDLAPAERGTLMSIQRRQKLVGTNSAAIAGRLAGILTEIENNRLEDSGGALQERLAKLIIEPMLGLSEKEVPAALQHLDAARRLADEAPARSKSLAEAIAQQEKLVTLMREILRHMVKSEGYQEAVNLLYAIQNSQQDVYNQSVKELQERIQKILRPQDTKPK